MYFCIYTYTYIYIIYTNICYRWKIQGIISCKHPKRTYNNANGSGEISTWDLVDETGSINIVAFNLNSNLMSHRLIEGRVIKSLNKICFHYIL